MISAPKTAENVQDLMKIQMVVLQHYNSKATSSSDLNKRLNATSSLSEQKNILLIEVSYLKQALKELGLLEKVNNKIKEIQDTEIPF